MEMGNTLVIANPAAHSGKGAEAAEYVQRLLKQQAENIRAYASGVTPAGDHMQSGLVLTQRPGEATLLAAEARTRDTVIALGGDGIVHEVVNGLMRLSPAERPRLGVIPLGSGNDFARTLSMRRNDPSGAIAQLLAGSERPIDLGRVNGVYFVQTLSFGLDAAVALDTTRRRVNNTPLAGAGLFATSGMRIFSAGLRSWPYAAKFDGERAFGDDVVFAVQNGPTYGGGFRICPEAKPADGLLDVCYSLYEPSMPYTLAVFARARFGAHTHAKALAFRRVHELELEFPRHSAPPCQVDGEKLEASRYTVEVEPRALRVIVPPECTIIPAVS